MDLNYNKYFVTDEGSGGMEAVRRDALRLVTLLDSIKTKTKKRNIMMARNATRKKLVNAAGTKKKGLTKKKGPLNRKIANPIRL